MNKKITWGLCLALMSVTAAITFLITSTFTLQTFNDEYSDVKATAIRFQAIEEINEIIKENYYSSPDNAKLISAAAQGYVSGLGDKYSVYNSRYQLDEANDVSKSSITGIGIDVKEDENGFIKILKVTTDTSAAETLKIGDIIVKIGNESVKDIGYAAAVQQIRLRLYDGIEITVRRDGLDETYYFVNQTLDYEELVFGEMLPNFVAYIKISRFESGTGEKFSSVLKDLVDKSAKSVIIDLRGNGGGLISEAEKVLDALLPEGEYAKAVYKNGYEEIVVRSKEDMTDLPLVILVNGKTASAAELTAITLRDYRNAKLIGVRTFGKGIMQKTFTPKSGGSLTLTVATLMTLKTPSFHGIGIMPDYEIALPSDLTERVQPGVTEEDLQLAKALEILTK